jgi:hypothetical protein
LFLDLRESEFRHLYLSAARLRQQLVRRRYRSLATFDRDIH